jgi:hypothetical protein
LPVLGDFRNKVARPFGIVGEQQKDRDQCVAEFLFCRQHFLQAVPFDVAERALFDRVETEDPRTKTLSSISKISQESERLRNISIDNPIGFGVSELTNISNAFTGGGHAALSPRG